ncbi:MAG TPA: HEAT repeat domain-containing protein [Chthonomonadaceae bacterium]|nr:HEAT repeat domain-containing protein [Chthonomonadaceae bacterium]
MPKRAQIERTLQALRSEDEIERRKAASRLGKTANMEAVGPLCRALHDPNWRVRRSAAGALGRIGSLWADNNVDEDVSVLLEVLEEGPERNRNGIQQAVEPLCGALNDRTLSVRREAATALGLLKAPDAVEPLCRLLTDKKGSARASAILALTQIGLPAIPSLCRRLTPAHQESSQSLLALQNIVKSYGPSALYRLLQEEALTPEQRWNALTLLQEYRSHLPPFSAARRLLTDLRRFCESAAQSGTEEVRTGALKVLEYTTLARASQRNLTTEQDELLRGAQGDTVPESGATLLRGSERSEAPAPETRSLWASVRRWLKRE